MAQDNRVADHYGREGLIEEIFAALREAGKDVERLTPADLAPVDHFHSRGAEATADLADSFASAVDLGPESHLADLGCGLGGPARKIAGASRPGSAMNARYCASASLTTALSVLGCRPGTGRRHGRRLALRVRENERVGSVRSVASGADGSGRKDDFQWPNDLACLCKSASVK